MCSPRDADCLRDIIGACERILDKTEGMSYGEFMENQDVMDICAMQCQIIGNAAYSVSDDLKMKHPEIQWRGMYGARCIISHGYGFSSYDIGQLWAIVSEEVEKTLNACRKIVG